MEPIWLQGKRRLRAELIGQRSLNQLSPLRRACTQGRQVNAAFLPIDVKPGLTAFCQGILPPAHGEMPIRLLKCAVFDRIRYQLVQHHRERLNYAGAQPNASRSVKRDRTIFFHTNRLRR